jgi:nucleotide-binding universal stress UspA family protein
MANAMLIAHACDLTGDDTAAFVHASALAAASGARLVSIHVTGPGESAAELPDAAALAARWGRPITHERRCHDCCDEPADALLDALRALRPALVVLGTHARHGLAALVRASVSEAVARNVDVPALVVPNRSRGFVDAETGAIDLRRVVIPAGNLAEATRGIAAAEQLLALTGAPGAELELVHVGTPDPSLANLGRPITHVGGPLEQAIVELARARDACVIVMPTRGHDGIGDIVLGSHTERVIREATCPVLSVPM